MTARTARRALGSRTVADHENQGGTSMVHPTCWPLPAIILFLINLPTGNASYLRFSVLFGFSGAHSPAPRSPPGCSPSNAHNISLRFAACVTDNRDESSAVFLDIRLSLSLSRPLPPPPLLQREQWPINNANMTPVLSTSLHSQPKLPGGFVAYI